MEAEHVLNRLWIGQAEKSDSGNYSCTIPGYEKTNFPRARVRVHVMDGKLSLVTVGCGVFSLPTQKSGVFQRAFDISTKEVKIVYRLFLVNCYLLKDPSQLATWEVE